MQSIQFFVLFALLAAVSANSVQKITALATEVAALKNDLNATKADISETKKIVQSLKNDFEFLFAKGLTRSAECVGINVDLTKLSNKKNYYFSTTELAWKQADEFCKKHSMHLASPKTQQELTLLHQKTRVYLNGEKSWWVSASDVGRRPGEFKWQDGQELPKASTLWNKERTAPNSFGQGSQACVYIATPYKDKLDDAECTEKKHFICDQPTNSTC